MGRKPDDTSGLLHKVKRAVIFQVLKRHRGSSMLTLARVLGISDHTLTQFITREGFNCADDIEGPYPSDVRALAEISDVGLESAEFNVAKRRLDELEVEHSKLKKAYDTLLKLQQEYAHQLGYLAAVRHRNKLLRNSLEDALKRKCEKCDAKVSKAGDCPTPAEIEAACREIRAEAEARYRIGYGPRRDGGDEGSNGYGETAHKVYKLRTKDRR